MALFDESHFPRHCAICKTALADHGSHLLNPDGTLRFPCGRCRDYRLSPDDEPQLPEELTDDAARFAVSHHVNRLPREEDPAPRLTIEVIRKMRDDGLPGPSQQADNLIRFVGDQTHIGHTVDVSAEEHLVVIGCRDATGLEWIINHLVRDGLLTAEGVGRAKTISDEHGERRHHWEAKRLCLTMKGRSHYEELKRERSAEQTPAPPIARIEVGIDLTRLHPKIIKRCQRAFEPALYDEAILNALKTVEDEIRTRISADPTDVGVELVTKAMGGNSPRLIVSSVKPEQEAAHLLFRGAIGLLKNPQSHRFVDVGDPVRAFEVLAFGSLLMRLLDEAELRPEPPAPAAREEPPPRAGRIERAARRSTPPAVAEPGPRIVLARAYVDQKAIVSPDRELIGQPYVVHAVLLNDPPEPAPTTLATDVVAEISIAYPDGTPVLEHVPGRWEHTPVPSSHFDPPQSTTIGIGQRRTLDLAIKHPGARMFAFSNESYRARDWQYDPFALGATDRAWRVCIRLRGPRLDQTFELALIDNQEPDRPPMIYAADVEDVLRNHPSLRRRP
jgi:uncharacterized protein (TIGR02391 family)